MPALRPGQEPTPAPASPLRPQSPLWVSRAQGKPPPRSLPSCSSLCLEGSQHDPHRHATPVSLGRCCPPRPLTFLGFLSPKFPDERSKSEVRNQSIKQYTRELTRERNHSPQASGPDSRAALTSSDPGFFACKHADARTSLPEPRAGVQGKAPGRELAHSRCPPSTSSPWVRKCQRSPGALWGVSKHQAEIFR